MLGRLTKERITKDVRYQESREVTLEWWDYNYHSRVTSFFLGIRTPRRTKATHSKKPIHLNFNINYFLRLKSAKADFSIFMWLFSRARPLCRTLVRLRLVDHAFCIELRMPRHTPRRTKATHSKKTNSLEF